jgi:hypothetical protein
MGILKIPALRAACMFSAIVPLILKRKAPVLPGLRLLTNPWHLPGVFDSLGYVEATRP